MTIDSLTYIIDHSETIKAKQDSVWKDKLYSLERNSVAFKGIDDYKNVANTSLKEGNVGDYKLFTLEQDDGVFALLLISFLCITRIYKYGSSFFTENIRLLFSSRKDISLFSQTTINEFWFNFILIFQSILLASIIIFDYVLNYHKNVNPSHSFYTILLFILTITTFLVLKYGIYKLISYIFNIKDKINIWLRSYMINLEMMGIVAFIPVLMLIYSQRYYSVVIIFLFCLFIVSRIIIFYRIIMFFIQSDVNFLFLIAYLCAIEIIPYILLFNLLNFLYKIDLTSLLWL